MRFFTFKQSALKLAIASALVFGGVSTALAGTVGGSVTAINSFTESFGNSITVGSSTAGASNAQTDTDIVTGQIDNNNTGGWKLKVTSANRGRLTISGTGSAPGREILYTSVKLFKTGGTLGAGLTDPGNGSTGVAKNIVTPLAADGVIFNTGSAVGTPGTATTATVAYAYALRITWASDLTALAGTYSDTIVLTLANDS